MVVRNILQDKRDTYAVQISKLNSYSIVTHKYNLLSKADALLWAVKMIKKGQYATIVKLPNKYYYNASRYVRGNSQSVNAYELGETVGIVRLLPNGVPVVVDGEDEYMYLISDSGRAIRKTKSIWERASRT